MNKIYFILTGCLLLSACNTISPQKTPAASWDCTGLDVIEVNKFDKKHNLFFKDDAYYIKRYQPTTFTTEIALQGCMQSNNTEIKEIVLLSPAWYTTYSHGRYNRLNAKIFDVFIKWANQDNNPQKKTLTQINQEIASLKTSKSDTPPKYPDWYVAIDNKTGKPVLVSHARDPALRGMFSNRTLALTKEQAVRISVVMNMYWGN
ncbi:MAG: hypothetical protein Q4D05_07305 [Acinetobacter sp.]|nr:hypothetical protein [Acinetobacter sp.]